MQGGTMTPEEEAVEKAVYNLIELGLVETYAVDEKGNFTYRLTELGKEAGAELKKED
jgi:DNA-binding PadR family transcriptional regulator